MRMSSDSVNATHMWYKIAINIPKEYFHGWGHTDDMFLFGF